MPLRDSVLVVGVSMRCKLRSLVYSISGLVAEYIVAIDVTRARFPADAGTSWAWWPWPRPVHVLFPQLRAQLMPNLLHTMVKIMSLGRCQSTRFGRRGRAGQSIDRLASYATQHTLQTAPVAGQ